MILPCYTLEYMYMNYSEQIPFNASLYPPTHELIVTPSTGVLLPKDSEGTKFTITYKPKSFNKSIKHVLKVEVNDTMHICHVYMYVYIRLTLLNGAMRLSVNQACINRLRNIQLPELITEYGWT